ncbi:DMT family transporter [Bowmanella sp. Y26]|uniref:DMT family transporter n=1 Tax=Bowmanella yangjiangensis TaxID=2811230 RepID=UPI001BDCCE7C|nr:DMT family transporter [Bowmanella yangjiangensis]MBT1061987.1 DMT family transporter [Bowmanella yangjiangensis]
MKPAISLNGASFMGLYAIIQSAIWALVRHLSGELSTETIFLFRNLIGAFAILPLLRMHGLGLFKTDYLVSHLVRAAAAFIGGFSIFLSVALLPLSSAVSVSFSAPVFASLGALWFFKERLTKVRLTALGLGFAGVLVTLRPSFDVTSYGLVAAYLGACMTAVAFLMVKRLSSVEQHSKTVAYPFIFLLPLSCIVAYFNWTTPKTEHLPILLLIGGGVILSQFCLVRAMSLAEASRVLPIDFLRLVFATALGVSFFNDNLDLPMVLGGCIIFASAILLAGDKQAQSKTAKGASAK